MDIEAVAEATPDRIHTIDVEMGEGVTDAVVGRLVSVFALEGQAAAQARDLFPALYCVFTKPT